MKKAMLSTLCSALVVPGLGQILNQELKKGLVLLGAVFLLFVAGIIKLVQLVHALFRSGTVDLSDADMVLARLRTENTSLLWVIAGLFFLVWIYALVDAYVGGRRIDRHEGRRPKQ